MNDYWPGESSEEWPEFSFKDVARGVFMPHTVPLTLAQKVLDRRPAPGRKVVPHAALPPVAQNAREVQNQLGGMLRTVKALEDKVDDVTGQLAVLQGASTGSQAADLFRQSLTAVVLAVLSERKANNLDWGGFAYLVPVIQNFGAFRASMTMKPVATIGFPVFAALLYAMPELIDRFNKRRPKNEKN